MEWLKRRYRRWRLAHPRTATEILAAIRVAENGDRILLYEGDGDAWFPHPNGVAIVKGRELLLNGRETLFKTDAGPRFTSYARHPKGFLVIARASVGRDSYARFLLNGERVLYEGQYDLYRGHPEGIIWGGPSGIALNGKLLYRGVYDQFDWHPDGVIIRKGVRLLLNGERVLYGGMVFGTYWMGHAQGFILSTNRNLYLNGKELLYNGPFDDWSSHEHGVLIRRHKRFELVVHKTFDADRIIV